MDYTHLGRTGIKVSRIALGTMEFGWQIDEADSVKIVDEALDAGINLFEHGGCFMRPGKLTPRLLEELTPSAQRRETDADWSFRYSFTR